MKLGFLYAGQGSQHAGMGADLYEAFSAFRAVYDHAEVDFDLKKVTFEDPDGIINQTRYTQPCMVAFAAGMTAVLREKGITPAVAAGLSLGEYSALHAAGVFDAATAIRLVAFRGKAMEEAAAGRESAMMAVLNLDRSPLQDACDAASDLGCVVIANYNCPGQLVIGGEKAAVEKAAAIAKEKGVTTIVIDSVAERLEVAREFGADHLINMTDLPQMADREAAVKALTGGRGTDAAVEVTGVAAAVEEGLHHLAPMGRYVIIGTNTLSAQATLSPGYITRKKLLALVLLGIFAGTGLVDLFQQALYGTEHHFFETIYTVLIFADIALVLLSQQFMPSFHAVFRNSGFVVGTLLMRLSFSTSHPWNAVVSVVSAAYVLGLTWAVNYFPPDKMDTKRTEKDEAVSLPGKEGRDSGQPR